MAEKQYKGLGPAKAVVRLIPSADLRGVTLSAQEGFVLSRVDGTSALGTLCVISGLGEETTVAILTRLRDLGLIQVGDQPAPPRASGAAHRSATSPGGGAASSPRSTTPARGAPPRSATPTQGAPARSATPAQGAKTGAPAPRSLTPEGVSTARSSTPPKGAPRGVTAAAALLSDEPGVELSPEMRGSIRAFFGMLQDMNFFELLDVAPDADATTLKRAYFKRSKEFHPDRYFNKKIGPYKEMLQEIFKQVSAAYRLLEDEGQREAYRQMVQADLEQQSALRRVEEQGARAMREAAREAEIEHVEDTVRTEVPFFARPRAGEPQKEGASAEQTSSRGEEAQAGGPTEEHPQVSLEYSFTQTGADQVGARPKQPDRPTTESASCRQLSEAELQEREQRREGDRKRRRDMLSKPLMGRLQRAQAFYEQGVQQLTAGQNMAAAASLNLAVSFNPTDPNYKRAYDEALEKSRSMTAEIHFKRGVFEESVGRFEAAAKSYMKAADLHPKATYLERAAEFALAGQDLIKARDYGTRAVQADEKSVEARITLAKVYAAAGMALNARRELQTALKLDSGNNTAKELLKSLKD